MGKIKVFIIDDSALVRETLRKILEKDPEIEVLGSAMDPFFAAKKIKETQPDVITLDVEMPRMDGLSFLKKIMSSHPLPVVMISSWTSEGGDTTLKALEFGALDFIEKPTLKIGEGLEKLQREIISKVKAAAEVDPLKLRRIAKTDTPRVEPEEKPSPILEKTTDRLIAIGASTGGTTAVRSIFQALPYDTPPIIAVLHMPPGFTRSFAAGLNKTCRMKVKEASHNEALLKGHAYIAPGDRHLLLDRSGAQYYVKLNDDPPYNRHRPSVDKTFFSIAQAAGKNALGFLLTGMGNDGAEGLLEMKKRGGLTRVQDEASSIVYGMPKQALTLGAAEEEINLQEIPAFIQNWNKTVRK